MTLEEIAEEYEGLQAEFILYQKMLAHVLLAVGGEVVITEDQLIVSDMTGKGIQIVDEIDGSFTIRLADMPAEVSNEQ